MKIYNAAGNKKTIRIIFTFFIIFSLIQSGCSGPSDGNEGTITIAVGAANPSRALVDTANNEQANFSYEIILTGAARTIKKSFPAGSAVITMKVPAGEYVLTVRAIGDNPYGPDSGFSGKILRALGENRVNVEEGKSTPAIINMVSMTEVENWKQLKAVVDSIPREAESEEIILMKKSFNAPGPTVVINGRIVFLAKSDVTITRSGSFTDQLFDINGGELTLKTDSSSRLIIDGGSKNGAAASHPLIWLTVYGRLEINDGIILQNNNCEGSGGGVYVANSGTFTMNGGIIRDNHAPYGGGVFLTNGTFIMNGGTINRNTADNSGGGIYIGLYTTYFQKNTGAEIKANVSFAGTATGHTAAVWINNGEILTAYRDNDITNGEILSITIDNTGNNIAAETGDWSH